MEAADVARIVLNVGGGSKTIPLPRHYEGWEHHVLDVDPEVHPDILLDARLLKTLAGGSYDAVYCSHTLEHFFEHEVSEVLAGFAHMLKEEGFAEIRVPDVGKVLKIMAERNMDIEDVLYHSPSGPIVVRDVLYGYGRMIARSGTDFMAHRTGFSPASLRTALLGAHFRSVEAGPDPSDIYGVRAVGFKNRPTPWHASLLGIPG